MNPTDALLIVAVTAAVTFLTRFLPFAIFGRKEKLPNFLTDLNKLLPSAIIAVLVVYCLKSTNFQSAGSFLPQLISVAVVAVLHIWKRNNLLSIGAGTVCYMLLV